MVARWAHAACLALVLTAPALRDARAQDDDVADLLKDDDADESEARRIERVRRLGESDHQSSAEALAEVVRTSSSVAVRREAARCLGEMKTARAPALLSELIVDGGPLAVREAVARAALSQDGGLERVVRRIAAKQDDALGRIALVAALGSGTDPGSRRALDVLALGEDDDARATALAALRARADAGELAHEVAAIVVGERDHVDSLVTALDLLRNAALGPLEPLDERLRRLASHPVEAVAARATYLQERLAWLREMAERDRVRGTQYAKPGEDPREPEFSRPAIDEIWSIDTTASQRGPKIRRLKDRIAESIQSSVERGTDMRVGIVLYRDDLRDANQRRKSYRTKSLPLTYDLREVLRFVDAISADGVDTDGQCISAALHEGLGRMPWRSDARRRMHLVAENMVDRPQACGRLARLYTQQGDIALLIYSQHRMSDQLRALAAAAGTTLEGF